MKNDILQLCKFISIFFALSISPLANAGYSVGQWGFSSDHLPVSATIKTVNGTSFVVASFNVLNEAYKSYLLFGKGKSGEPEYERGQQLRGSELDRMTPEAREAENLGIIQTGFAQGLGILGLQECSPQFIHAIEDLIIAPSQNRYSLLKATESKEEDEDYGVVIFDQTQFELISTETFHYKDATSGRNINYIQKLRFRQRESDSEINFINTHVPFKRSSQLLAHLVGDVGPTVVVGDVNLGLHDSREESSLQLNLADWLGDAGYQLVPDLAEFSHINTEPVLDLFDHILVQGLEAESNPEMTQNLRKTFSLYNRN